MKKIVCFITLIFVLGLFILPTESPFVRAVDQSITLSGTTSANNQGQYIVREVKEVNNLPYGVRQFTHLAESTTTLSIGGNADGAHGKINTPFQPGLLYTQQVNVLEVPSTEGVRIVSWGFLDDHRWTLKTVRALMLDYEAKHPGWKVIGAVNGDFFDIGASGNLPYQTSNSHAANGHFFKTTTGRMVGFTNDGTVNSLLGDVTPQRTDTMLLSVYNANGEIINTFTIDSYNQAPTAGKTSVFYGIYNNDKQYVPITMNTGSMQGYFVDEAELALPNHAHDFYGIGTISSSPSSISVGRGQFGIVSDNPAVNDALSIGTRIRVQWQFKGFFANIDSATGVGETFLRNGEYVSGSVAARHPRTVIGRKPDGTIVMAVIDGRQGDKEMHGMHGSELAAVLRRYGAVEGYNLDGGGSSTLMIRKGDELVVMNSPSDGWERTDSNALLIVARDPEFELSSLETTTTSITMNLDLLDAAGHNMEEIFVRLGNATGTLTNGSVTFTGLRADTEYNYSIRYRDKSGKLIDLKDTGVIMTSKVVPTFRKVNVVETTDSFTFTVDFTDRGNAGNFNTAPLWVNGEQYHFAAGTITLLKADVGQTLTEVRLEYTVDLNNNHITTYSILNPQHRATMALNVIVDDIKQSIRRIYD